MSACNHEALMHEEVRGSGLAKSCKSRLRPASIHQAALPQTVVLGSGCDEDDARQPHANDEWARTPPLPPAVNLNALMLG